MVVKKKLVEIPGKDLSIRLSSKLNQVREAISQLPEDEGEQMKPTKKTARKGNAAPATNGANGTSLAEICKPLKIEPRTARRILRNAKVEVEGGRWTWTKAKDVERIRSLLKEKTAE